MRRRSLIYICLLVIAPLVGAGLMLALRAPLIWAAPTPQALPDLAIYKYRTDVCSEPAPSGLRDDLAPFAPGNEVMYELHFINLSLYVANDVRIVDTLPPHTTYVASNGPGFTLVQAGPDHVVWVKDRLSDFERGWLCVRARVDDDAPVGALAENTARILALDPEGNYDNNEYSMADYVLSSEPDLAVRSDLYGGTPGPGQQITYRIAYMNEGGGTAHDVRITDTLPISAAYVADSRPAGVTTTITGSTVVWTLPPVEGYAPVQGMDMTPSDKDLYLTVQVSGDYDPNADWLENVVEISTSDVEFSYRNNRSRFALKPEADRFYGAAVTSLDEQTMRLLEDGGYDWMLYYLDWSEAEPFDDQYDWQSIDDAVWSAWTHHLRLVVRVDRAPAWARGPGTITAPPANPNKLGDFLQALSLRWPPTPGTPGRPQIDGYVIWNEPNLAAEWGGNAPSAAAYVSLLQAAFNGVKAGSPDAWVVSAGLAPSGDNLPTSVDDRSFLQDMYTAGAPSYFDLLGVNPMGFASAPDDESDPHRYYFARALEWRAIMEDNGDGAKQVFATEVGWLRDTAEDLGGYNWIKVSEIDQAHYLARAFHKARLEWSWMRAMMLWNLDFAGFYPQSEHAHWFGVTDADREPLRSYLTLQNAANQGPADLWLENEAASGEVTPGGDLRYVIHYANIGGQSATGVVLTDTFPAGTAHVTDSRGDGMLAGGQEIVWDVGTVGAGARKVITLTLRLIGDPVPGALLTNTVRAGALPGEPFTDDNAATAVVALPDLSITKSVFPEVVGPGAWITYTLAFHNDGQAVARGVVITDLVPVTLTQVHWSARGVPLTPTGSVSCTWQVRDLAPGDGGTITLSGAVSLYASGMYSLTNGATITTTSVDADPFDNGSAIANTVDANPPVVVATSPEDGAMGVSIAAPVIITFSEPIASGTFTYSVTTDPGAGSVSWSSDGTVATLRHAPFGCGQAYTVSVIAAIDLLGNSLDSAPAEWRFTTAHHTYLPLIMEQSVGASAVVVVIPATTNEPGGRPR